MGEETIEVRFKGFCFEGEMVRNVAVRDLETKSIDEVANALISYPKDKTELFAAEAVKRVIGSELKAYAFELLFCYKDKECPEYFPIVLMNDHHLARIPADSTSPRYDLLRLYLLPMCVFG